MSPEKGTFTVTEGGVYHSDPSTQTFKDFRVEAEGGVMAASQDTVVIKNNFTNLSNRSDEWATDQAILQFVALDDDITHNLSLPGANLGLTPAGYDDNFAWGKLILGELDEEGKIKPGTEQTVYLFDGNETAGGALYVGEIKGLLFEDDLISNIYGHGLNIYYNPNLPGNEYLGGLTYAFMDAGQLIATPVPASILLLGSGLLGLGLLGRRRKLG